MATVSSCTLRLRRAHALVAYWDLGHFILRNYISGRQIHVDPIVLHLLEGFTGYVTQSDAERRMIEIPGGKELLKPLIEQHILLEEGVAIEQLDQKIQNTWRWGHEARFFHYSTRNVPYERDIKKQRESLLSLMQREPPISPFKIAPGPRVPLPGGFKGLEANLGEVLLRRRTQRDFTSQSVSFDHFTRILNWTWGCTHRFDNGEIGPYILKTSPSGGARHSIEVYPLVMRVEGLATGTYHYSVEDSALVRIAEAPEPGRLRDLFSGQPWRADAPVIFVMTSRIARSDWKYRHPHAYRVLLLDAGHLGQTFHLVCTALGLAPFTLAGFKDTGLENILNIDGVSEIPLYVAACGYPATSQIQNNANK